jgi:hypothetical protein
MAFYSATANGGFHNLQTSTNTGVVFADAKASPLGRMAITEIAFNGVGSMSNAAYSLSRSTSEVVQIGATAFKPYDPSDSASASSLGTAWDVNPVFSTNAFRRWSNPTSAITGVIWTFPRGLSVAPLSSIVIWSQQTNSNPIGNISVEIDE